LVIQDVLTLHGRQFRDADLILASPPCPEFSYMAMPWSRSKQIAAALRGKGHFPEGYTGSRTLPRLTALFESCFRIQREACEAAGGYIPMVVENVKGAQPWVGRAKAHFGSFYLWGDIAMVGGRVIGSVPRFGDGVAAARRHQKTGGNWFAPRVLADGSIEKISGGKLLPAPIECDDPFGNVLGSSPSFNGADHETRGVKAAGNDTFAVTGKPCRMSPFDQPRFHSSGSNSRKAASALIARIPLALSRFVAQLYFPNV
jgi:hypothetical protein